ncbi:MAG: SAM-dependent chlorinase/fluorinase [Bacteroidales bacterium]|nr:SAM-dependent chlorinase/fluorinase [Bacteroidales bacterium]
MRHPIITLTTDWGTRDFFAGMVKGRLLRLIPEARIIDITHEIAHFDQNQAAFVVKHACMGFPEETIHLIDVNAVESKDEAFVVVRSRGQYFICTDNGMPAAVFGNDFEEVVQLNVAQDGDFYTFAAYNLFCKVAKHLAEGGAMADLGYRVSELKQMTWLVPIEAPSKVSAHIAYIDSYGNANLDLTYERFEELRAGRHFVLTVSSIGGECVSRIVQSYDDGDGSERITQLVLTVSSTGYLQLAVCRASAERLLGLKVNSTVDIDFK